MEDQSYVEEGYEDYVEDQQYEDYSNMGDGTEISKGEFRSSKYIRADEKTRELVFVAMIVLCVRYSALRNEPTGEISNLFNLQVWRMLTLSWMISSMPISASIQRDCMRVASVNTRAKIATMSGLILSQSTFLRLTSESSARCATMCVPVEVLTECI